MTKDELERLRRERDEAWKRYALSGQQFGDELWCQYMRAFDAYDEARSKFERGV